MGIRLDNSLTEKTADTKYLKLDQSTSQTVSSGKPLFSDGVKIGNANTYFTLNGDTLELYVNSTLVQSWTIAVVLGYLLQEDGFALLQENGDPILLES